MSRTFRPLPKTLLSLLAVTLTSVVLSACITTTQGGFTEEASPDKALQQRVALARALALEFRLARQERDVWVNWPARAAALMAADLGVEPAAMQKVLEKHVRAQLDDLAEVKPDLR